jgi:hypothetical protein
MERRRRTACSSGARELTVGGPRLVPRRPADALLDSLWERQLRRAQEPVAAAVRELVYSRTRYLWCFLKARVYDSFLGAADPGNSR